MTHKNIVRYYQAWVEGGKDETMQEASVIDEEEESTDDANAADAGQVLATPNVDSDDESQSWWTNSPLGKANATKRGKEGMWSHSNSDSSESWSDNGTSDGPSEDDSNDAERIGRALSYGSSEEGPGIGFEVRCVCSAIFKPFSAHQIYLESFAIRFCKPDLQWPIQKGPTCSSVFRRRGFSLG